MFKKEGRIKDELNKEREIAKRIIDEGAEPTFVAKVTGYLLIKSKCCTSIQPYWKN